MILASKFSPAPHSYHHMKVVVVGDPGHSAGRDTWHGGGGHKSELFKVLEHGALGVGDPDEYMYARRVSPNQSVCWSYQERDDVDVEGYQMELWDTSGQEALETLRKMAYPGSDVVLVSFSFACLWLDDLRACAAYL